MALFQRPDRAKRDFLKALKSGQLDTEALRKGLVAHEFDVDDVLWCLYESNKKVQQFGLFALGRSTQDDKTARLIEALRSEAQPARRTVVAQAIGHLRDPNTFAHISRLLNSPDVEQRRTALEVFLRLDGWHRQRELVTDFLEDPDPGIALAVTRHVVKSHGRQYEGLLRHLAIHPSIEVRTAIIDWLISQRNPDNAEVFFNRLAVEEGSLHQKLLTALTDLAKADPEQMTLEVIERLGDDAEQVRRTAMELFTHLPDPRAALRIFLRRASGTTDWIRDTMFSQAAPFAERFVDPLLDLFDQGLSEDLRHHALSLAHALKHPRLVDLFLAEFDGADWFLRHQILSTLSELGSTKARPLLLAALEHKETRVIAVKGLVACKDPEITARVLKRLPDLEPDAQIALLEGLEHYPEPRVIPRLLRFIDEQTRHPEVITACAGAITQLCEALDVPVPRRVRASAHRTRDQAIDELPDLGLRLVDD